MIKKLKEIKEKVTGKISKQIAAKPATEEEEFIELEPTGVERKTAKIHVKYFILTDFADIKGVLDSIREGYTIALLKIKPLKEKDMNELKRAVSKIKKTTEALNGEVVGIDEDWIIAVPSFVEIYKGEPGQPGEEIEE
ncbi:MAG: cell division protein SepF [Candidatus Parvarchaeota archaeon]|nr:cell division protein SepF [Candidatus Jingweiarchaeum tengchongense]MCW1298310.1 cell division protein SepF [Candidatus Jingweiarchaeum tengchongense]MCW1300401.1 cell division protein SepF [Candidatus Jingweiarchaeum tengchongense]MCW1305344.1 cell division protein SepF [Candidatus Jingweiarchaeum tengchongense]MCW1310548.1 cell division protein SepF [Candidatus Jingweiarchaeum tengchongense]